MTTTPESPAPDDGKDEDPDPGAPQPGGAPGVELGMSEGPGGTFEPEEDVEPGS